MTGRGGRASGTVGGPLRHVPVLLAEVRSALEPGRGGIVIDGTFGAGGYSAALLAADPAWRVIGIDRDPSAIAAGQDLVRQAEGRLTLVAGHFGDLDAIAADAGATAVDGVVLDIGVSSMQIDDSARGFSFRGDGPLDMRMEQAGRSAADIVNEASEEELADIFYHFGEERRSRAVARAIVERRRRGPMETTGELAELVAAHVRTEPGGMHPATRVFQALRIAVNDELGELVLALHAAERVLAPGGRLAVVTFHSLEDRIVKQFMAARMGRAPGASRHAPAQDVVEPTFTPITRGPIAPSAAEVAANPRARSAKLRACARTEAPAQEPLAQVAALAELPERAERRGAAR